MLARRLPKLAVIRHLFLVQLAARRDEVLRSRFACAVIGMVFGMAIVGDAGPAADAAEAQTKIDTTTRQTPVSAEDAAPPVAPLDPQASLARAKVHDRFRLELVVAEPLVADPVAIDWGADGSLWVAEMADYPYGMDNQGKPGGRVRRLRDTDGDGRYDQSELFLEGLPFPTGVMAWRDGVLVTAAPELFFARDRDGDGRADERQVLFRGFVEGNQQLRVNGLRYGIDHWVYCAAGGHHAGFGADNSITLVPSDTSVPLGSRDFRFDPDSGQLQPLSGPSQFGRVRNDWNHWFGVQNSYPLWHYVLEDHYLRRNSSGRYPDVRKQLRLPANPPVFAISQSQQRYHSFEHAGHYTSACGPCIYRDALLFGSDNAVTHAFTCEPFHNVVQHHVLREEGVTYRGQRAPESESHDFYASSDPWSRPVMARTGPDGALWIVDMYRYMIEHPDWLPEEGRDDFRPFYRSGDDRGRIYRIVPADAASFELPQPLPMDPEKLVERLTSGNGWIRDKAQQLLIEMQAVSVTPLLASLARNHSDARTRLHALATLDALSRPSIHHGPPPSAPNDALLIAALGDAHPEIRRHALRFAEPRAAMNVDLQDKITALVNDPDPKVRLQLAFTLGQIPTRAAGEALAALAADTTADRFLTAAIVSSAATHQPTLLEQLVQHKPLHADVRDAVFAMASAQGADAQKRILQAVLPKTPSRASAAELERCLQWLQSLDTQGLSVATLRQTQPELLESLAPFAVVWQTCWELAASDEASLDRRLAALALLRYGPAPNAGQRTTLQQLLQSDSPSDLQRASLEVLARDASPEVSEIILGAWPHAVPLIRNQIVDIALARAPMVGMLLDRIAAGDIAPIELSATQRDRLTHHSVEKLAERARTVLQQSTDPNRAQVIQRYRASLDLQPQIQRGATLFTKHCATCHASQTGAPIGPQLHALSDRSLPTLLVSILDPSRAVEPTYFSYQVELKSGQVLYGVIVGESGATLRLRQQDGTVHEILRGNIEQLHGTRRSFMPDGLEAELSPQDLADLMGYVQQMTAE